MSKDKSLKQRILDKEFVEIRIREGVTRITLWGQENRRIPTDEFFALFDDKTAERVKKEKAAAKKKHDAAAKKEKASSKKSEAANQKRIDEKNESQEKKAEKISGKSDEGKSDEGKSDGE